MKQFKKIFFPAIIAILFSSCLKDGNVNINSNSSNVVFFNMPQPQDINGSIYPGYTYSLKNFLVTGYDTITAVVDYSGPGVKGAPQDITVNLSVDTATLNAYNTNTGKSFVLPSSTLYKIPSSITIKQGQEQATFNIILINGSNFSFSASYAIPLKISSTSTGTVSTNYGSIVFPFLARNQYDGVYSVVSGTVTRYTAPGTPAGDALSGNLAGNPDVYLVTASGTSVNIPVAGAAGCLQWAVGNNSSVAGIDGTSIAIAANNSLTLTSQGNATLANWPGADAGYNNTYNPSTKTFSLGFWWNPTANVRTYEVILKYKSARP